MYSVLRSRLPLSPRLRILGFIGRSVLPANYHHVLTTNSYTSQSWRFLGFYLLKNPRVSHARAKAYEPSPTRLERFQNWTKRRIVVIDYRRRKQIFSSRFSSKTFCKLIKLTPPIILSSFLFISRYP